MCLVYGSFFYQIQDFVCVKYFSIKPTVGQKWASDIKDGKGVDVRTTNLRGYRKLITTKGNF